MREKAPTRGERLGRLVQLAAAIGLVSLAAALSPSLAAADERMQDGGFEASACDATECVDPAWTQGSTSAFASGTGPICRSGTGSGNTACDGGGSAPFSGSTWARLGAGYKGSSMFDGGIVSWVEQTVSIPTAPATLSFRLRIIDAAGPTGQFKVEVGGSQVFAATDATPGFAAYAPVTIDLSSLAGTAPLLHLEGFSSQLPVGALDSFDVDDISLITTDPVTAANPNPRCAKLRAKLKKAKKKKVKRKIRKKLRGLGC